MSIALGASYPGGQEPRTDDLYHFRTLLDMLLLPFRLPVVPDFNALPRDALPFPTPSQVCAATEERLRSAGLSGAKARYVRDIATRFCDGRLDVRRIVGLCQSETVADTEGKGEERPEGNEAEVIKELVQIK